MFRALTVWLSASLALALTPISPLLAQTSEQARTNRSVEEIVVTAQKREENLQDVPVSISVLGGDQLEHLSLNSLADFAT